MLEEAVEFGISHFCTGEVFGVPSVSRIIREQKEQASDSISSQEAEQERASARFKAMMTIAKARREKRINRRNTYHLDLKIDIVTNECLRSANWPDMSHDESLLDKIRNNPAFQQGTKDLPQPIEDPAKARLLSKPENPTPRLAHGLALAPISDSERRSQLPSELLKEDKQRLHSFFFERDESEL